MVLPMPHTATPTAATPVLVTADRGRKRKEIDVTVMHASPGKQKESGKGAYLIGRGKCMEACGTDH